MSEGFMTFLIFTFITMIMVGLSVLADSKQCQEIGKALNYQTEWYFWSGCVVTKPDGEKVLLKQMRNMGK